MSRPTLLPRLLVLPNKRTFLLQQLSTFFTPQEQQKQTEPKLECSTPIEGKPTMEKCPERKVQNEWGRIMGFLMSISKPSSKRKVNSVPVSFGGTGSSAKKPGKSPKNLRTNEKATDSRNTITETVSNLSPPVPNRSVGEASKLITKTPTETEANTKGKDKWGRITERIMRISKPSSKRTVKSVPVGSFENTRSRTLGDKKPEKSRKTVPDTVSVPKTTDPSTIPPPVSNRSINEARFTAEKAEKGTKTATKDEEWRTIMGTMASVSVPVTLGHRAFGAKKSQKDRKTRTVTVKDVNYSNRDNKSRNHHPQQRKERRRGGSLRRYRPGQDLRENEEFHHRKERKK